MKNLVKNMDPEDFEREFKRRRAHRNMVLAAFLVGLVLLMYVVTLVKLGRQGHGQESGAVDSASRAP